MAAERGSGRRRWGRQSRKTILPAALATLLVLWGGVRALTEPQRPERPYYRILRDRVAAARREETASRHPRGNGFHYAVIAHRGGMDLWPENTLYAFHRAHQLGVDVLELDVWLSRDGVPVIIHDETVDRTTNGSGRVAEQDAAQLRQLDARHHWDVEAPPPGDFPLAEMAPYALTVPTLEQLFRLLPEALMLIEIKSVEDPRSIAAVGDLINAYGRQDRTMVASFDASVLRRFRRLYPQVATSAGEREVVVFKLYHWLYLDRLHRPRFDAFQVPERSGPLHVVTPRFLRNSRRKNLSVEVWTVNDPSDMQRLGRLGVDGIITDRPDTALELRTKSWAQPAVPFQ